MNKTAEQLLRNPDIKPTKQIIADGLGEVNNIYESFVNRLKEFDISLMDWRYYNDGKAWLSKSEYKWTTSRGTERAKPIFWLSIWKDFFKISFLFSEKTREKILTLPISDETEKMIQDTAPHGNKMQYLSIVFNVEDDHQLNDIYILANFKKEAK